MVEKYSRPEMISYWAIRFCHHLVCYPERAGSTQRMQFLESLKTMDFFKIS